MSLPKPVFIKKKARAEARALKLTSLYQNSHKQRKMETPAYVIDNHNFIGPSSKLLLSMIDFQLSQTFPEFAEKRPARKRTTGYPEFTLIIQKFFIHAEIHMAIAQTNIHPQRIFFDVLGVSTIDPFAPFRPLQRFGKNGQIRR